MTLDTAIIELINHTNRTLYFYRQFTSCFECPLLYTSSVKPLGNISIQLNTYYKQLFAITGSLEKHWRFNESECNLCEANCAANLVDLYDQSKLQLSVDSNETCNLEVILPGRNNLWSLLLTLFVYISFVIFTWISPRFYYKFSNNSSQNSDDDIHTDSNGSPVRHSNRFYSIDSFRGITILLMIFVNYGAGRYKFLQHVPWDGFHLADIVFPFFIFLMGVSIAISFKNLKDRSNIRIRNIIRTRILPRTIKLFLLGIVINSIGSVDFSTIRIPGVLQRFSISYAFVSIVHILSSNIANKAYLHASIRKFSRYFRLWPEYLLAFLVTLIYFYFTFFWHYDDNCPVGYIGPGGLSNNISHPYCVGGAAHKIDEIIFTAKHCYKNYFGADIFDQKQFNLWHDPEGLLGTTMSVLLTLIGLQAGYILVANPQPFARYRRWIIQTLYLVMLTIVSIFWLHIPINKNLWSFSFVTLTGSIATITLAVFHYLIDIKRFWHEGSPFHFAGQNAILLYLGHEIAQDMFPFVFSLSTFTDFQSSHIAFLIPNLIATTVWFWISVCLARKEIFFTV